MDVLRPAPPLTVVAARLRAAGHHVVVVDGRGVRDKATALAALSVAAGFPTAATNLDAAWDWLCDLSWLDADSVAVVWTDAGQLSWLDESERSGLLALLDDAADAPGAERGSKVARIVLCYPA